MQYMYILSKHNHPTILCEIRWLPPRAPDQNELFSYLYLFINGSEGLKTCSSPVCRRISTLARSSQSRARDHTLPGATAHVTLHQHKLEGLTPPAKIHRLTGLDVIVILDHSLDSQGGTVQQVCWVNNLEKRDQPDPRDFFSQALSERENQP